MLSSLSNFQNNTQIVARDQRNALLPQGRGLLKVLFPPRMFSLCGEESRSALLGIGAHALRQSRPRPSQMDIHTVVPLRGIPAREKRGRGNKGRQDGGSYSSLHHGNNILKVHNVFRLQYLLPQLSHSIFTTTLLCIFPPFQK